MPTHSQLEIDEDISQQQRMWRIERAGWTVMALLILLTLLGFTGHGHFSERVAGSPEVGFTVAYNRFERYAAPTRLTLRLGADIGSETRLRIGNEFLRCVKVLRVDPQPERVESGTEFQTYVFATCAPGMIVFHYEPTSAGALDIRLGLDERPVQTLSQFVYP